HSCHHGVSMSLRLATAKENGRSGMEFSLQAEPSPNPRGWDFSLRAVLPPCRLKPELHACFGGTDRHATVGAALCGRPSLRRRGAPTDLPIATGAGIFPDASVKSSCPPCLRGEQGVLPLQGHCLNRSKNGCFSEIR